jgi:hypothetical protein
MSNIDSYKERFYGLMESTMGDVRPLVDDLPNKKVVSEGILTLIGGMFISAAITGIYKWISNYKLKSRMIETGQIKKSQDEKIVMKQYKDKKDDSIYWGVDFTDSTQDEGWEDRKILLFKGDDPRRVERIIKSYEVDPEKFFNYTDEDKMSDNWSKRFGPNVADLKIDVSTRKLSDK